MITKPGDLNFTGKALDSISETMYPYQYKRRNGDPHGQASGDRYPQGDP
jgi:hypothetical protein